MQHLFKISLYILNKRIQTEKITTRREEEKNTFSTHWIFQEAQKEKKKKGIAINIFAI